MAEKTNQQRINNIIGQLNGVSKMLDNNNNCTELLVQMKSIKSAINSMMNKIIEEELDNCIINKNLDKESFKKILKDLNN